MVAGIIGAAGYAGSELVRLLSRHSGVTSLLLGSVSLEGEQIEDVYPNFLNRVSFPLKKPDDIIAGSDIVFSALPHGVGEAYAKASLDKGVSFIDLSADFRFDADEETFRTWYGKPYTFPDLHTNSIYGLPELNRQRIKTAAASAPVIIGNPGCYPTAASLGILPALAEGLVSGGNSTIIVDAASGITGGGREPQRSFHFPECSDSFSVYKVGSHRHTPEINRNITTMADRFGKPSVPVIFTPHLAPMNRGILCTIYIPLEKGIGANGSTSAMLEIRELYAAFYKDEPFVRVLPQGVMAATGRVRQSNFCDISINMDHRGEMLIVVTAIDNMVKGAAGQAVQNMNIIMNFDERSGLDAVPALF